MKMGKKLLSNKNPSEILNVDKQRKYFRAFETAFKLLEELAPHIPFDLNRGLIKYIFKDYEKIVRCVKKEMMQLNDDENIDSHKISSIFLIVILKHTNIVKAEQRWKDVQKNGLSTFHKIPHIYFAFILGSVIMEALYNEEHKKEGQGQIIFNINMGYGKEFAKMVYANQKTIVTPALTQCSESAKVVFCMSHIFYFIESVADKQPDI